MQNLSTGKDFGLRFWPALRIFTHFAGISHARAGNNGAGRPCGRPGKTEVRVQNTSCRILIDCTEWIVSRW